MTLRRLFVLLRALPADALFRHEMQAEHDKTLKPTAERIRERQAHYAQREAAS